MAERDKLIMPIEKLAKENDQFREVIWTGDETQLVLMTIPEGGEIGGEVHEGHDQLLYFVEGTCTATLGEDEKECGAGEVAIVPSGKYHNFVNTGSGPLKLYTTYSPPEHKPGKEHDTKADQDADPDED